MGMVSKHHDQQNSSWNQNIDFSMGTLVIICCVISRDHKESTHPVLWSWRAVAVPCRLVAACLSLVVHQKKCGHMPGVGRYGMTVCTLAAVTPDLLPRVVCAHGTPVISTRKVTYILQTKVQLNRTELKVLLCRGWRKQTTVCVSHMFNTLDISHLWNCKLCWSTDTAAIR
jgi:hypothetical protein